MDVGICSIDAMQILNPQLSENKYTTGKLLHLACGDSACCSLGSGHHLHVTIRQGLHWHAHRNVLYEKATATTKQTMSKAVFSWSTVPAG